MHRTGLGLSSRFRALAGITFCGLLLSALFPMPAAASALQVVKAANHEVTSGATNTVAINIAAGDLAVVWCSESVNNTSVVTISDSSGGKNIWTQTSDGYVSVSPTARGAMFYSSLAAQLTSVKCAWSGGINGRVQTVVYDISGAASSGIEDASINSTNTNNVTDLSSNASGNTLTTTNANDILLFGIRVTANQNQNSFAAGTNYTIPSGASGIRSTMSYRIVSSTQSAVSTDISYPTAAINGQGIYAAFKAAAGTGGTGPSISSLSPSSGTVGATVVIAGSNFGASQGASTVTFNGTVATPTSWSDTSITVPVPSGATTGNVIVNVGGVASNPVAFTVIVPPSITSLSPTFAFLGASVTISGSNFGASQGTSTVTFNGIAATPTSWSATSIVTTVPSGATTGNVVVTVNGLASNGIFFRVAPNITGLSPTAGPIGTSMTITGNSFGATQGTSAVTLGASTVTPTSWSDTVIVAPVPAGATTGNLIVMVNGVGSNRVLFTVTPAITSLSPASGPVGTSVTITGTSFGASQGTSTVAFNGTAATPTSWSDTGIVVPVPSGATTGNVVVNVGGFASNGAAFTVTIPPNITNLNPTSGAAGVSVTITGTNFGASQGTGTVTFNGTTATPTSWGASAIAVTVPTGATTGNVVVTVGSLASNGVLFTVLTPPIISSLNPASGGVGAGVVISGTNFGPVQGSSTVSFNGTLATPAGWNGTTIFVTVPANATSGNVVVTVNGLPSNGVPFTANPISVSVSPTAVTVGTGAQQLFSATVQNETQGNGVTWSLSGAGCSGAACGSIQPYAAGPGEVYKAPAIAPNPSTVTLTATSVGDPTKSATATITIVPVSVSVSPSSTTVIANQSVGYAATVQGDTANLGVTWTLAGAGCSGSACGTLGPATSLTNTGYTAPGTVPNPPTVTVTATSVADPTKSATSTVTIVAASPNITGLSPASGPTNTPVTITGSGFGAFQQSSTVAFNGASAAATSWSDTSIVALVPNSATTGNVVVTVSGTPSNGLAFTILPNIAGLSPTSGSVTSPVTVSGSHFGSSQGTSTVTFNGTVATPASCSATSIVVPVPSGATTGNVVVTVGGLSSNGVTFTVVPDNTPPTAPSNLTATASSAGEIDLFWSASTDNVGVSGYQVERCQGTSCTNFTLFSTVPEPNSFTGLSDVSVVGSTSYSYRVRATDAAGNLSAYSNIASATTPGAATITSLSPASGPVGTSVTITGTGFGTAQTNSTVSFNGTQITFATSWSDTSIVLSVPTGATTGNVVVTVGTLPSNGVNFTVTPPPPPPSITILSPSSAVAGGGPLTLTVNGTNFVPSSVLQWNGSALATTFLSSTQLQAQVTSTNIASPGAAKITVFNASGSVSNVSILFVGTTGGTNFATIVVNQAAQDIVYDPANQVFYLSVPGTASTNPNTIAVLDPTFAAITSTQPIGNNPHVLAISDDSQFLYYAGIDGTSTVQRFTLPGLTPDITIPLGTSPSSGPYYALDLQVAPGAPHTTAITLGAGGTAQGGITIFDDATPRPANIAGFFNTGFLFDSLQWGADANTLFASNTEDSRLDFYTLTVNSSGVTLNQDFQSEFDLSGNSIHFDRTTNLIYAEEGQVISPATGIPAGNFNVTGTLAVDGALNTAFFAANSCQGCTTTVKSFDLTHFTPIKTLTIPSATGAPLHLIRWGQNGLAFINRNSDGTSQVILLGGDFVSAAPPFVTTPPPAPVLPPVPGPNAPTIASLNPSSSVAGSAAFVLNIIGTQFDPAATVQFNGAALSTTYVSSTQLQALIPATSVASPGTASVVVANPSVSGGNSASATFFVGSTGGTSSAGTGFAVQIMNQAIKQIAFDAASQRFYLSVPNSAATGNTIAVLDPATGTIIGQQYAGSNPDILAISDDGQFLYAGIDGSSSVQRFILPGLATDISYSLGAGPYPSGPFFALDLQVAPGSPHTTAVTRGAFNSSPSAVGGIEIFDDALARAVIATGFGSAGGSALYDSLQWGADPTVLFASNTESSGYDFYTLSVTTSGVSQAADITKAFSNYRDKIHFDRGTQLIYANNGQTINPVTGVSAGTFAAPVPFPPSMVPDSSLNLAFFANQTGSSSIAIYSFNLSTFAPVSSITISNVNGNPVRLIRWGQNGLAFNTDAGQIVLLGGNFVH